MKTKNLTLAEAVKTGLPARLQSGDTKNQYCFYWTESEILKRHMTFTFQEATEPIWEVKAEPREWTVWEKDGTLHDTKEGWPHGATKITVREVIE